ncbi:hypothetical protein U1Q18_050739 [Sarracenia purpurea var. burkii]
MDFLPSAAYSEEDKASPWHVVAYKPPTLPVNCDMTRDAIELDQLINYLINKEESKGVVLLRHSTGCQNIVYYMRTNAACSRAVRAAIFQRIAARRIFKRLILGSQKAEAGWIRFQLLLTQKESSINVPMNLDARRRITFFTNSLFMNMPKAPKVRDMQSFSMLLLHGLVLVFRGL